MRFKRFRSLEIRELGNCSNSDSLRRLGFSIPGDLGIMGFDNTEVAHLLDLTTIDYPVVQQAENAFSFCKIGGITRTRD